MYLILVVDDDESTRESFRMILKGSYRLLLARSGEEALGLMEKEKVDLAIVDIIMPGMSGLDFLEKIKKNSFSPEVIMVTASKTVKTAIEAMKLGAADYITKPFDIDEVKVIISHTLKNRTLKKQVEQLRREVGNTLLYGKIVGQSPVLKEVLSHIWRIAKTNSTVLISGESGSGKELIARAIHNNSSRNSGPFIPVHCAALAENLLESELFGHERGAFTGAVDKKIGQFELAHGGTLFLDEIVEIAPSVQVKLLRALEQHEFLRVGGSKPIHVDIRLMAASSVNLKEAVRHGRFREDLYYRLNVVPLRIPPLRERKEDIPLLVDHFLSIYRTEMGSLLRQVSPEALSSLVAYDWPGNIRELRNIMERMVALHGHNFVLEAKHVPPDITGEARHEGFDSRKIADAPTLDEGISRVEKILIEKALKNAGGVQTKAAKLLKTTRRVLKYKMDKYGIKSDAPASLNT
jgi:DNA-binding NtrC family response regulator